MRTILLAIFLAAGLATPALSDPAPAPVPAPSPGLLCGPASEVIGALASDGWRPAAVGMAETGYTVSWWLKAPVRLGLGKDRYDWLMLVSRLPGEVCIAAKGSDFRHPETPAEGTPAPTPPPSNPPRPGERDA